MSRVSSVSTVHDISFIVPIRVDTSDRLENCDAILRFLTSHFPDAEIQVIEQDTAPKTDDLKKHFPNVLWQFTFNEGQFSRSRALNQGFLRTSRRCVCAYDTDILIDPEALRRSAEIILSGRWPIVIPFNLIFVEVSGAYRRRIIEDLNISDLSRISRLDAVPSDPDLAARVLSGAIVMCDRAIAVREGGYNRNMISYGWEDIEFFKRFERLGHYSHALGDFNLIHLDHRRGPDSRINERYASNKAEFDRILSMPKRALEAYVANELRIGPDLDPKLRKILRRKQVLRNWLTLRRALYLANRASTLLRTRNRREFFRSLIRAR